MNDFFTNLSDIWGRLGALFSSYNFVVDTIDILLVALLVYKIIAYLCIVKGGDRYARPRQMNENMK